MKRKEDKRGRKILERRIKGIRGQGNNEKEG